MAVRLREDHDFQLTIERHVRSNVGSGYVHGEYLGYVLRRLAAGVPLSELRWSYFLPNFYA